jgi:hypothetical protein
MKRVLTILVMGALMAMMLIGTAPANYYLGD